MTALPRHLPSHGSIGRAETAFALLVIAAIMLVAVATRDPITFVKVAALPAALVLCVLRPVIICALFMVVTYFRLHEAYPFLGPLNIPQFLGALMVLSLLLHVAVLGNARPNWQVPLKWLAALVGLIVLGLIFSLNRDISIHYFKDLYWKILVTTLAIAWLVNSRGDFQSISRLLVLSGMAVAAVVIHNKIYGLSLVEGTRVSIGRPPLAEGEEEWTQNLTGVSQLADPNDLALILLFPLAFAIAMVLIKGPSLDRLLGFIGGGMIMAAIVFTQSRGGLLGVIAVFGFIGLNRIKSRALVISLCAAAALGLAAMMGLSGRVSGGAAELSASGIDESARGRLVAWHAAINMMLANPLTGVGIDGFVDAFFRHTPEILEKDKAVHSTWFQVMAEMGLPGIVVFVGLFLATFRSAYTSFREINAMPRRDPVLETTAMALVSGLAGFAIAGTFLTQPLNWPLYILIALTLALRTALDRTTTADDVQMEGPTGRSGDRLGPTSSRQGPLHRHSVMQPRLATGSAGSGLSLQTPRAVDRQKVPAANRSKAATAVRAAGKVEAERWRLGRVGCTAAPAALKHRLPARREKG